MIALILKLFTDLAKALNIPVTVISHGVVLILAVGCTVGVISIVSPAKQKIEMVPELKKEITLILKNQHVSDSSNKAGHAALFAKMNSMDSIQRRSNYLFRAKIRIDSMKFSKIPVLNKNDYFQMWDEWFRDLQSTGMLEKKNNPPILYGSNRTH